MRLAVLGAGFIGLNFIRYALNKGVDITVLDHKNCPPDFLNKLTWVQGDFSREELLLKVLDRSDIVLHFISSTVPGDAVDESVELMQNVALTLNLLKCCLSEKITRIIFVSSASVYGHQSILPISEKASTDPISSHGISKLTIEKYLQLYRYHFGLDCKILRLANPYGPGQDIHGRQGFVAMAIGKLISGEKIFIRGDGSIVRDYIYIDDVCEALYLMCLTKSKESIFNIGSGEGHSLNSVVDHLSRLVGNPIAPEYIDNRSVDVPVSTLDITRGKKLLGFTVNYTFERGMTETLRFHNLIPSFLLDK